VTNLAFFSLRSVRMRLTLWNVGILALVLGAFGAIFYFRVQDAALSSIDHRMARFSDWYLSEVKTTRHPLPERPQGGRAGDLGPRLLNDRGEPLYPSASASFNPGFSPPLDRPWDAASFAESLKGKTVSSTIRVNRESVRVYSVPIRRRGAIIGVAQFAHSLIQVQQDVDQMTKTLLTLIPLGLLVTGVGGAFLTDRALRPVRQITDTASRIEAENLSGRLAVTGRDEFADLAETFNGMLTRLERAFGDLGQAYARLETAFEQQRRFTADASHELRTPLAIIKANSSLALTGTRTPEQYKQKLESIDAAANRMNQIVQDLLLLARSDSGQLSYAMTPVFLGEVLKQSIAGVQGADLPSIRLDLPDGLPCVRGHGDTLVRLFGNLLENAVRHTLSDGCITISADVSGDDVAVSVSDTGEGIAPEHLPHVTERFYRADAGRARTQGGTGLGLAICQSIVEMHGGCLGIESALGKGTTVRVTLPRAAGCTDDGS
jgi:signal transduction histidine kinase